MGKEDNIGSRFIITLDGNDVNESFIEAVSRFGISSVLIQKENIVDKEQLIHLMIQSLVR